VASRALKLGDKDDIAENGEQIKEGLVYKAK
jgi:hypothetical protein